MGRPLELAARTGWYLLKNKVKGRFTGNRRFPLVTMLEPLEKCNLACEGCGRIREYERVLDRTLTVEQCMAAVEESGAPIVSIAGGEPTIHPQIADIVNSITQKRKRNAHAATQRTRRLHELLSQHHRNEAIQRAAAPPIQPDQQSDTDRQCDERGAPLGRGETEVAHGNRRSRVPPSRPERAIRHSAVPAKVA